MSTGIRKVATVAGAEVAGSARVAVVTAAVVEVAGVVVVFVY